MYEILTGIKDIRKRVDATLENFKSIYGCYVNAGQIISNFEISILDMTDEEKDMYSKLLKKGLSGKPDKNLIALELGDTNAQKSLYSLSKTNLNDSTLREMFYNTVIENLTTDKNYCILLTADTIDTEESSFPYFLCDICPIKETKAELRYTTTNKEFRSNSTGNILSNPVLGFTYPALIDGAADIYTAVYFFKKELHEELIEGLFDSPIPKTADEQKEEFQAALMDSLTDDYTVETTALIQSKLSDLIETEDSFGIEDIKDALSGIVDDDKLENTESILGNNYECSPENLVEKKFTIETTDAVITTADPVSIKIQEINGRKYILVPASGVIVNGKEVSL